MKTFIVFIAGFALAVLGLMSFESYQAAQRETQICHDCETDTFSEIPLEDFYKDLARYRGTHAKDVKRETSRAQGAKVEPSRVCTYTLDTLKKFICFIETYAKASGISPEGLGINFYYAVYKKDKTLGDKKVGSLHTLYLTPTFYDTVSNVYEPLDVKAMYRYTLDHPLVKDISPRAFYLDSLRTLNRSTTAFMLSASTFSTLTASPDGDVRINQGQLCPPACNGIRLYDGSVDY